MGSSKVGKFHIESAFKPSGDQPQAIKTLTKNIKTQEQVHQVLLGVTGSGKTFTMAHVIQNLNVPTLILAPNKTLAAQLFMEFKELFPHNAVEYFVSYYDYYQPEAYIPSTNTYIEKDSAINEQIDRMRHAATFSLLERNDVIIVSSVSCIYGIGSPDIYKKMILNVEVNQQIKRDSFLKELIKIQYSRNDMDFHRGTFRARGDVVEVFPPSEDSRALRIEFFGDYIDQITWFDPIRGEIYEELSSIPIYPVSHHVSDKERTERALVTIKEELDAHIIRLKQNKMLLEAQRLEQRTLYDLEMIEEMGFCQGIENYSRHFTGRAEGEPPPTLLEYFPEHFLCFIDESHVTVPQLGGMYRGDRSRKMTLVEHGFRLPSALDNRPLNFEEFQQSVGSVVYVSATPGDYEIERSPGKIIEQIIRPTGLVDPEVEVRPATNQVDDLLGEIRKKADKKQRVLVTTLTKKSSEDLTDYLSQAGVKVRYLHSDIKTMERSEIIRDLRIGIFDVLVGINLLREGLDIPEVGLVAILDADKEGFLRSERSLIQTIGRAARNAEGRVILYADHETDSIKRALFETNRRRKIQQEYNKKHHITPQSIQKEVGLGMSQLYASHYSSQDEELSASSVAKSMQPKEIQKKIKDMRKEMKKASDALDFETAAQIRDEIKRLEMVELESL